MVYYIDKSIVDLLESDKIKYSSKEMSQFSDLLDSVRNGYNIIYLSFSDLRRLYKNPKFSKSDKIALKIINSKYQDISRIIQKVKPVILYYKDKPSEIEGYYESFPLEMADFSNILLVENIKDYDFYISMTKKFIKYYYSEKVFDINLREANGGGGMTATYLIWLLKRKKNCVCIVDSDKKHFGDSLGSTSSKVLSVDITSSIAEVIVISDVKEAENLLPPKVYKHFFSEETNKLLNYLCELDENTHNEFLSFVQCSKGLKIKTFKELFDKYEYYYKEMEDKGVLLYKIDDLTSLVGDETEKCIFGGGFDKFFSEISTKITNYDLIIDNEINSLSKNLIYIPKYLEEQWKLLFTPIFSFGVCLSRAALIQNG